MADTRAKPAGIARDIANKISGKRDPDQEREALQWIAAVTGEKIPDGVYEEILRDGTILCKFANKLMPGSIKKIHTKGGAFTLMQNIAAFQTFCKQYGVEEEDVFQTVDLWDKRNIPQVTKTIFAIGRTAHKHPEYDGPEFGPKPSNAEMA